MFMSVVEGGFDGKTEAVVTAFWQALHIADADKPAGQAAIGVSSQGVGFMISDHEVTGESVLGSASIALSVGQWALRVDEVAFPVGAVAHRHTHSGSGWRHLVSGALRIEGAHGDQIMHPGDSWFEPAHTPVRAVALDTTGVTRFVRCMAIPLADIGQSTFQLVDPADATLPRLQMTHRHFDHVVQVDAG